MYTDSRYTTWKAVHGTSQKEEKKCLEDENHRHEKEITRLNNEIVQLKTKHQRRHWSFHPVKLQYQSSIY